MHTGNAQDLHIGGSQGHHDGLSIVHATVHIQQQLLPHPGPCGKNTVIQVSGYTKLKEHGLCTVIKRAGISYNISVSEPDMKQKRLLFSHHYLQQCDRRITCSGSLS